MAAYFELLSWGITLSKAKYKIGEQVQVNVKYKVKKQGWTGLSWSVNAVVIDWNGYELDRDGHTHAETTTTGEGTLTPRFIMTNETPFVTVALYADAEILNAVGIDVPIDTSPIPPSVITPPPGTKPSPPGVPPVPPGPGTDEDSKKWYWIGGGILALALLTGKKKKS